MARPKINRVICAFPKHRSFEPTGYRGTETVTLTTDEYEIIRLHDLEHLDQSLAAKQMRISRPTAALLLTSAHKKIAQVLVEGKRLCIEDQSCCVCEVGLQCPKAQDDSCDCKHRCGAACKDKFKDCQKN